MEDFIFNEKLLNKYHNENERRIAREEGLAEGKSEGIAQGIAEGMAAQKAEDEKLIQKITEEKDAEIARLKALLAEKNN